MKVPNAENAVIELENLTEYCLDPVHPRGKHKARVFEAACGFNAGNAVVMQLQLLEAVVNEEFSMSTSDRYGDRYVVECVLTGPTGQARVRTAWIVRRAEDFPRFVSAYVI